MCDLVSVLVVVSSGRQVRQKWVDICTADSGNSCCAADDGGMGSSDKRHEYWIMLDKGRLGGLVYIDAGEYFRILE